MELDVAKMPRTGLRYMSERSKEIGDTTENSDGTVTFSGYMLHWDDIAEIRDFFGEYRETFEQGSFQRTIQERGPSGSKAIKMFRQHDGRVAQAGKFTDLHEDDTGLAYEARTINTSVGKDVAVEIREGVMDGMSVGFDSLKDLYEKTQNLFRVQEARMWEGSPVYWPAYQSGTIDSFRGLDVAPEILQRFLRAVRNGEPLSEEVIGQLTMIRATISEIIDGPPSPAAGDNQSDRATVSDHARTVTRLRLLEREYGLS